MIELWALGLRRVGSTKDLNWRKKTLHVDRSVVFMEVWISLMSTDVDNQNHITCNVVVLGNFEPSSTPILFNNGTGATWLWITLFTIDKTLTQFKLAYDNANLYNTIESSEIIPSIYIFFPWYIQESKAKRILVYLVSNEQKQGEIVFFRWKRPKIV